MPAKQLLNHLQRLLGAPWVRDLTDQRLMERFESHRDAVAFAEIVKRHGPLVWGVCCRVLRHEQDAEDAFQAAFLVLARRAGSVPWRDTIANWLYAVAYRVSAEARTRIARRRLLERKLEAAPRLDSAGDSSTEEWLLVLDEELNRLPNRYRAPLVFCYLKGQTREQAARALGWSLRTLERRLGLGRELLRTRLTRRGITSAAALSVAALTEPGTLATVPAPLVCRSVEAAIAFAKSASGLGAVSEAAILARSALAGIAVAKLKSIVAVIAMATLLTAGVGLLARQALTAVPDEKPQGRAAGFIPAGRPSADAGDSPKEHVDRYDDPLPPRALARMGTTRFRHGSPIVDMALSPDGKTVASVGRNDGTLRLWEASTGKELRRITATDAPFVSVAFSPDGNLLAAAQTNFRGIRVWDARTWKEGPDFDNPQYWHGRIAFSPDSKLIAAAGSNHRIPIWDAATGRLVRTLDGKEECSFSPAIAFSADGRLLAAGRINRVIQLWDVATGAEIRRVQVPAGKAHPNQQPIAYGGLITSLVFSRDQKTLASCGIAQDIHLWDAGSGQEIRRLPGSEFGTWSLAFSANGSLLAGGSMDKGHLWEAATGREMLQFDFGSGGVGGIAFARDGQMLFTGSDAMIRRWDIKTGREIASAEGHAGQITYCGLLPDQRTLVTAGTDGTIRRWDAATGKEMECSAVPEKSREGTLLSPDGRIAASGIARKVEDGTSELGLKLWELSTKKELALLWKPNTFWEAFSPDSKTLVTTSWDLKERAGIIRVWDVATGTELRQLGRHTNSFTFTALSPDGRFVAALKQDREGSIHVWETVSGREVCKIVCRQPDERVLNQCFAFSPGNKILAVADSGPLQRGSDNPLNYIHLWDIATGKKLRQFGGAVYGYTRIRFSPDGKTIATTSEDNNRITLWELATEKKRLELEGHAGAVKDLIFSEDGRRLFSSSYDTTVLAWDLTGGP